MAGVAGQGHGDAPAIAGVEGALGAEVVLHVPGTVGRVRIDPSLELAEDLPVRLADDVGEHVEPPAVRHPDSHLVEARVHRAAQDLVQDRDDGFAALQREPLLPHVLRVQERLEGLGRVEAFKDVHLLGDVGPLPGVLDPALDPFPLIRVLNVHVFDADAAAVRITQDAENVAQPHRAMTGEAADGELTVEVPQRQPVLDDVEIRMAANLELEGIRVGHEVAAYPVGTDEFHDPGALVEVAFVGDRDVLHPADGLIGDAQRGEDPVVETVGAQQQRVHAPQEFPGLGALDDPVVVGAGQREHLAHGQPRERLGGGPAELGRILHRPHADDRALARHEARHAVHGADAAGVRQRDRGAGEVVCREPAGAGAPHEVLVGAPERGEIQRLGGFDVGHDELALGALHQVDGQAEVDVVGVHYDRSAVLGGVRTVHDRHLGRCLDDRVADQVGEAHLPAAGAGELAVDDGSVVFEEPGGHRAYRGGGRHGQRRLHVGHDPGGGAAQGDDVAGGMYRRRRR